LTTPATSLPLRPQFKPVFYHITLWIGILVIFVLLQGSADGFFFTLFDNIILLSFYAAIIYFNVYYLIPEYLSKNKFLQYSLLLALSCLIITPIRELLQYFFYEYTGNEAARDVLLKNLNLQIISLNIFMQECCANSYHLKIEKKSIISS